MSATRDLRLAPAYTLLEAALCIRVPAPTLRAWAFGLDYPVSGGRRRSGRLIEVADSKSQLFSFVNLIEGQVLRALRKTHGLSLQSVRRALEEYRHHEPKDHPLAFEGFLTDRLELFVERYGELVNLSQSGQIALRSTLEAHLQRVERDAGGPVRLFPFVGQSDSRSVSVSPLVAFGRPVIHGTRIGTDDIVARIRGGDTAEQVANDLRLEVKQVVDACVFEESGRRAARQAAA